jgi:electron transport complex protein RnfC
MFGRSFHGGIHPRSNKRFSADRAIEVLASPQLAVIPLQQHIGTPSKSIVNLGDQVKIGQPLSEPGGFVSVPSHASVAGTVKEIIPFCHPLGMMAPSVVIEKDPEQAAMEGFGQERDTSRLSKKDLISLVQSAGIAGLGGAAFPTHVKLSPPPGKSIDTLILNGVECEPYLTSDFRLMLEQGEDIIKGLKIMINILEPNQVIIGIEANQPQAITRMSELVKSETKIQVKSLRVKYPQGAEKQLIYALTRRQVPCGGLPMEVGCLVQNVGTALAVYEAVSLQKPLIERVVTVTGSGINEPKNLKVKIGTPLTDLFAACGGIKESTAKIILGGPLMGLAQYSDTVPVIKGSSGILVLGKKEVLSEPARTCISCGRCVDTCPMRLVPTQIAKNVELKDLVRAQDYGLMDCFECGCCSYICPAKIDIVHLVKYGKMEVSAQAEINQAAAVRTP